VRAPNFSNSSASATTLPDRRPAGLRITADDFGLSESVNEAVERAHCDGVLTDASLMVGGPAAADAVRRARALPSLRIGLHLVVVEGRAVLPPGAIPDLVDADGWFPADQLRLGLRYAFVPHVRAQLALEIAAQFAAFAATGLRLAHADAHKHMHLHPTVGRLMIRSGGAHGLDRIRIPREPAHVLAACCHRVGIGARALAAWTTLLRAQAAHAGLRCDRYVFGLAWSGDMTRERLLRLAMHLPDDPCELYLHPAARPDSLLGRLMPGYRQQDEFAALLDPAVIGAFRDRLAEPN
jgi:hopanoid biosynthesis associated protein HpnK